MTAAPLDAEEAGTASGRRSHPSAAVRDAVTPVAAALVADARREAEAVSAAAARDAGTVLVRAREEAARILEEARHEGARAAGQRASALVASTHREAAGLVLAARLDAYREVRRRALDALVRRADAPEGRALAERLEALARERVGPSSVVHRSGPGSLTAVAASGNRRAAIGVTDLVDAALQSLADQVAALWA